ncbi:restriction endonuclease subunit S [Granulicatella balaenopterae]|nr:restriction endonuclease subunit S [Granulicatella balaenopterae]
MNFVEKKSNFRKARFKMIITKFVDFEAGSPQFRIKEHKGEGAKTYSYYSQTDIVNDLITIPFIEEDHKQVTTTGNVVLVEEGDLIFSLISGKCAIAQTYSSGYLLTQNYVKLRIKGGIDKKYLMYLINEDKKIARQFQASMQGSITMKYTVKQLRELDLKNLPSIEIQEKIGDIYTKQLRKQALKERLAKNETLLILEKLKEVNEHE